LLEWVVDAGRFAGVTNILSAHPKNTGWVQTMHVTALKIAAHTAECGQNQNKIKKVQKRY